ncbi:hypothetical protein JCM15519_38420 [Fundidesulfovibrio butyratiphilus]
MIPSRIPRETALAKAQAAWGADLPDWVRELAVQCDQAASMAKVGAQLGVTKGAVSRIVRNDWTSDTTRIEEAVRRAWLAECVICPVLGEISLAECEANQARPFSAANNMRVRLYRACRDGCAHSRLTDDRAGH